MSDNQGATSAPTLEEALAEIEGLKEQLSGSDLKVFTQNRELRQENGKLREEVTRLTEECVTQTFTVRGLEKSKAQLEKQVGEDTAKIAEQTAELAERGTRIAGLEARVAEQASKIAELESRIAELEGRATDLTEQLGVHRSQEIHLSQELERTISTNAHEMSRLRDEHSQEIQSTRQTLEQARAELEKEMAEKLAAKQREVEGLEKRVEQFKEEFLSQEIGAVAMPVAPSAAVEPAAKDARAFHLLRSKMEGLLGFPGKMLVEQVFRHCGADENTSDPALLEEAFEALQDTASKLVRNPEQEQELAGVLKAAWQDLGLGSSEGKLSAASVEAAPRPVAESADPVTEEVVPETEAAPAAAAHPEPPALEPAADAAQPESEPVVEDKAPEPVAEAQLAAVGEESAPEPVEPEAPAEEPVAEESVVEVPSEEALAEEASAEARVEDAPAAEASVEAPATEESPDEPSAQEPVVEESTQEAVAEEVAAEQEAAPEAEAPTVAEQPEAAVAEQPEAAVAEQPEAAVAEQPEAAVAEQPEAAVAEQPEAAVAEQPEAAVAEQPEAAVAEQPEAAVAEQPEAAVAEQPEPEVAEQPEAEVAEQPEAEVAEQPEAEVAEQPEAEVAEQPEAEVAEQPEAEVAEQPEVEVAEQPEAAVAEQPEAAVAEQPEAAVAEQPEAVSGEQAPEPIAESAPEPAAVEATTDPEAAADLPEPMAESTPEPAVDEVAESPAQQEAAVDVAGDAVTEEDIPPVAEPEPVAEERAANEGEAEAAEESSEEPAAQETPSEPAATEEPTVEAVAVGADTPPEADQAEQEDGDFDAAAAALQNGDFATAWPVFNRLRQESPGEPTYLVGEIASLAGLERFAEAYELGRGLDIAALEDSADVYRDSFESVLIGMAEQAESMLARKGYLIELVQLVEDPERVLAFLEEAEEIALRTSREGELSLLQARYRIGQDDVTEYLIDALSSLSDKPELFDLLRQNLERYPELASLREFVDRLLDSSRDEALEAETAAKDLIAGGEAVEDLLDEVDPGEEALVKVFLEHLLPRTGVKVELPSEGFEELLQEAEPAAFVGALRQALRSVDYTMFFDEIEVLSYDGDEHFLLRSSPEPKPTLLFGSDVDDVPPEELRFLVLRELFSMYRRHSHLNHLAAQLDDKLRYTFVKTCLEIHKEAEFQIPEALLAQVGELEGLAEEGGQSPEFRARLEGVLTAIYQATESDSFPELLDFLFDGQLHKKWLDPLADAFAAKQTGLVVASFAIARDALESEDFEALEENGFKWLYSGENLDRFGDLRSRLQRLWVMPFKALVSDAEGEE